jgi:hypothetical protein
MSDAVSQMEGFHVNRQKPLIKFLRRRYWVFASDVAELKYGLESLVWTTNKEEKALAYLSVTPYSHSYLLDTKTGLYFVRTPKNTLAPLDLSSTLIRNQREFSTLLKTKKDDSFSF